MIFPFVISVAAVEPVVFVVICFNETLLDKSMLPDEILPSFAAIPNSVGVSPPTVSLTVISPDIIPPFVAEIIVVELSTVIVPVPSLTSPFSATICKLEFATLTLPLFVVIPPLAPTAVNLPLLSTMLISFVEIFPTVDLIIVSLSLSWILIFPAVTEPP